jgi:hypothetical protein
MSAALIKPGFIPMHQQGTCALCLLSYPLNNASNMYYSFRGRVFEVRYSGSKSMILYQAAQAAGPAETLLPSRRLTGVPDADLRHGHQFHRSSE